MSAAALTWPPERFYWAIIDVPGWRRRPGPAPPGFVALLADELPIPVEDLFVVCSPLPESRGVLCGAPRTELADLRRTGAGSLRPGALPECVHAEAILPVPELNLLVGEFEPPTVRRRRLARHLVAAGTVLLCSGLLTTGLARRSSHWARVAERLVEAQNAAAAGAAAARDTTLLHAELGRARQLAASARAVAEPVDAVPVLAEVLRGWPSGTPASPQSLAVTGSSIVVSVNVPGDATAFLSAFRPPAGWVLEEPRLNSAAGLTRLSLAMRPGGKEGRP